MFRLSRMTPHTAYCSYQPEAMATVLAQTSFAAHHRLHFIIDNTSAMADITNRAPKPNRSAGRLIQKLHQRAEQQFRPHWPKQQDKNRATATHQKSHTKQQTLPAFLNRCIDVLLTHSTINAFESQPDLTGEEYADGYILRLSNPTSGDKQHIFGDRRHAIYNQHMNLMRDAHTDSDSQGTVKNATRSNTKKSHKSPERSARKTPHSLQHSSPPHVTTCKASIHTPNHHSNHADCAKQRTGHHHATSSSARCWNTPVNHSCKKSQSTSPKSRKTPD